MVVVVVVVVVSEIQFVVLRVERCLDDERVGYGLVDG